MSAQTHKAKGIVVVYGCPGSGKSTFADYLMGVLEAVTLLVRGDDIEAYYEEHQTLDVPLKKLTESCRLGELLGISTQKAAFVPQNWKKSRDYVKSNISLLADMSDFVIFEDDYLLKSTRKPFKQYCSKNRIPFVQFCMQTPVEKCLELNSLRQGGLDFETIIDKHSKLEVTGMVLGLEDRKVSQKWVVNCMQILPEQQREVEAMECSVVSQSKGQITELQIRRYIGQVMATEFGVQLFPGSGKECLSKVLTAIKKNYDIRKGFDKFKEQVLQASTKWKETAQST